MRFNGRSGVEVRLPNDLEDLKGYTSLSLFLQRPESTETGGTENMFVMYLGNKDVSIALTFPWFLKQNMAFEVHDTAMWLPLAWQEEIPLPLMAPWAISHQFKVAFGGGDLEAVLDGPACEHMCVYTWARPYLGLKISTLPSQPGSSIKAFWRSEQLFLTALDSVLFSGRPAADPPMSLGWRPSVNGAWREIKPLLPH